MNQDGGSEVRQEAFGQGYSPSLVDRFGVWLSARCIRRFVKNFEGKSLGDFGCGYHASFTRTVLPLLKEVILADVSISPDLCEHPKVRALVGNLSESVKGVSNDSLEVILAISVVEHLGNPDQFLANCHRVLRHGGVLLVNVPSWRGKWYLELSAFRLGLSPSAEMDDHKCYYDPRDLWPLLVRAGFRPSQIQCFLHKFGLNTFAVCIK